MPALLPAGVVSPAAGQAQIGAALLRGQAVQKPCIVLDVQLVEDQVLRRDRDMIGGRVGGMIMDDALAAAGIDRRADVDERRAVEQVRRADVLRAVSVRIA